MIYLIKAYFRKPSMWLLLWLEGVMLTYLILEIQACIFSLVKMDYLSKIAHFKTENI